MKKKINSTKTVNEELYTYDDWYQGRISLGGIQIFDDPKEKNKNLVQIVSWTQVKPEDVNLIRKEQKEIFDTDVKNYLKQKIVLQLLFQVLKKLIKTRLINS